MTTLQQPTTTGRLEGALEKSRGILPAEAVLTRPSLDKYLVNCLSLERRIGACLVATTKQQVVDIGEIAGKFKIPLYPISGGPNGGHTA
ncbi:MAG: hypothetical protein P4L56_21340 [Candidatus Sulfopaludibacter sp.]|nr:hypothetical protein [Candidatus Sulfopaludibacter sp.]